MSFAPSWVVPVAGGAAAIVLFAGGYAWIHAQGAASQKPKTEAALDAGAAANLNTEGAQAATDAVSAIAGVDRRLQEMNHALDLEAARDRSADPILPDGVVDRLRRSDERVCLDVPALCDQAPAPEGGGSGNAAPD